METACRNCGAPSQPNEVLCEFCNAPLSAEAMQGAVRCPSCNHPCPASMMQCSKCRYVEQCLFCAHVSPIGAPACTGCDEAFAGMRERKAARDEAIRRQQMLQVGETVASVALPLVGELFTGHTTNGGGGGLLGALESLVEDVGKGGGGS